MDMGYQIFQLGTTVCGGGARVQNRGDIGAFYFPCFCGDGQEGMRVLMLNASSV